MLHHMLRAAAGTRTYDAEVLADFPVAYWRLGETSGTVAVDEVGSNDGTYIGTPTLGVDGLLAGDADTAVDFPSGNHYVDLGAPHLPQSDAPFSIEIWMSKTVSDGATGPIVSQYLGTTFPDRFAVRVDVSGAVWYWHGNGVSLVGTTDLTGGSPHHIAVTRNAAGMVSLYVDGVVENSGTDTASFVNNNTNVAQFDDGHSLDYVGICDEVAIYDFALSAARIEAHYNAGTA